MSLLAPAFTYQRRPNVDAQGNPLPSDDPTSDFPQDMTPTGADTPPPPPVSMPPAMGPPPADPSAVPPPVQAGGPQSDEQTAAEIAQMRSIPPEVNVQPKPTMRDRLLGHSNPTPPPVSVAANGAQQMPNAPAPRTPGILQRIAAAGLGAATGYVNAARRTQIDPDTIARGEQGILHPGYGAQMGAYNRTVQQIQGQADLNSKAAKEKAELENAASWTEQREATAEDRKAKAASYATNTKEKSDAAAAARVDRLWKLQTADRSVSTAALPGWQPAQNPDGATVYLSPATKKAPKELLEWLPGITEGQEIPSREFDVAADAYRASLKTTKAQDNKPDPTVKAKDIQAVTLQKVAAAGMLPDSAATSVSELSKSIRAAQAKGVITPQEASSALAYLPLNTTPAAQGTNTTIRMEGLANTREMPVLDTKNGNSPMFLSAAEINAANKNEPGRYIPSGPGMQSLNRTALIEDIRGSIGQTRDSLAAVPEFTATDKAMIAMAMRDRDPKSAVSQLIGGAAGAHMTPAQQEYLINLAQLHEQAMAMRSVLGAGQGSEDLRAAILRTIPGPSTPNKAYALKQLDYFEKTLNRLSRGVPKVTLRNESGSGSIPNVTTQAQYDALPKGAEYMEDGLKYRKP